MAEACKTKEGRCFEERDSETQEGIAVGVGEWWQLRALKKRGGEGSKKDKGRGRYDLEEVGSLEKQNKRGKEVQK